MPQPDTQNGINGDALVAALRKHLGALYVYGGEGPSTFDCSGLILFTLRGLGHGHFPRVAADQYAATQHISRSELRAGDLVFFGHPIHHVAVYSGNGKMIEAPQTWIRPGVRGRVREVTLRTSDVAGYGRVKGVGVGSGSGPTGGAVNANFPGSGVLDTLVKPVTDLADDFEKFGELMGLLMMPTTWVRIACGVGGGIMVVGAILFLVKGAGSGA